MSYKKDVFYLCFKISAYFLLFVIILLSLVSISALTDEEFSFCDEFNISSFSDCVGLWNNISQIYNVSNVTIYVNQTVYENVTEYVNVSNCTEEFNELGELDKIDEYQSRGYEPVFENGIIINFQKIPADEILSEEICQQRIIDAIQEVSQNDPIDLNDPSDEADIFPWIFGFIILAFIGYKVYKSGKFKQVSIPMLPPQEPSIHTPVKPKEETKLDDWK
jgi:hypothetical protein